MYNQKIKELEANIRKLDTEIFLLEKQGSTDKDKIKNLSEKKYNLFNELRGLYRLQYEDRQNVHYDDER